MNKKVLFRFFMLAAGLLAVAVILISSSMSVEAQTKKAKAEQNQEEAAQTFVSAPTEAIPGSAVKMEDATPSLLEVLIPSSEEKPIQPSPVAKELVHYFKILFRAFISPNAP
jgi:hypothetical protein